jgi:mutator protein MutT
LVRSSRRQDIVPDTNPTRPAIENEAGDRSAQQHAVTEIAVAVVEHRGRFLVGRRAADGPLPNRAEFPGGKREPGESLADAARREVLEECGLDVQIGPVLDDVTHDYPHGRLQIVFFAARLADHGPVPESQPAWPLATAPFTWVTRSDLPLLDFPPANARLLQRLLAAAE